MVLIDDIRMMDTYIGGRGQRIQRHSSVGVDLRTIISQNLTVSFWRTYIDDIGDNVIESGKGLERRRGKGVQHLVMFADPIEFSVFHQTRNGLYIRYVVLQVLNILDVAWVGTCPSLWTLALHAAKRPRTSGGVVAYPIYFPPDMSRESVSTAHNWFTMALTLSRLAMGWLRFNLQSSSQVDR